MEIASKTDIIKYLSAILKPIIKKIFYNLDSNKKSYNNIIMNIIANILGLGNAATPLGLKAMEELQKESDNKTTATNSMCLFLGMNTAGFQLIPTTVLAVLVGIGYKNPTEIIAPTLLVTTIAFVSAIIMAKIGQYLSNNTLKLKKVKEEVND